MIWLDLANAYGSVPHKLIEVAMNTYYVPLHVKKIARDYYGEIKIRFTVGDFTTAWQELEKGIVTGCTTSPILFVIGKSLMMTAAERETRGPRTKSRTYQPPIRGFVDDLTVTTTNHVHARWVISSLEETVTWERMKFKPRK